MRRTLLILNIIILLIITNLIITNLIIKLCMFGYYFIKSLI